MKNKEGGQAEEERGFLFCREKNVAKWKHLSVRRLKFQKACPSNRRPAARSPDPQLLGGPAWSLRQTVNGPTSESSTASPVAVTHKQ